MKPIEPLSYRNTHRTFEGFQQFFPRKKDLFSHILYILSLVVANKFKLI